MIVFKEILLFWIRKFVGMYGRYKGLPPLTGHRTLGPVQDSLPAEALCEGWGESWYLRKILTKKIKTFLSTACFFLSINNIATLSADVGWTVDPQGNIYFNNCEPSITNDQLSDVTRAGIPFNYVDSTLTGYLLFDPYANFLSGSLLVNGAPLLGYTQTDLSSISSMFNNYGYPQLISLNNGLGFVFFFSQQFYTAAQLSGGSVFPILQTTHQVFHKGINTVNAFKAFGGGFTVLPDASVNLNSIMTATGPIDLRETGTLILGSKLSLASHLTLSSGGGIYGNGNTIYLTGNTWIPSTKIFHIMNNTVINGQGYTLTIGDYGQLFVDNAVTLTLQNITLASGAKTSIFPPVRCAGQQSQLALDNVTLAPGSDIPFYQGKMYVYDNVHFTGTSALVYQSPFSTFIMPGGSLYADTATTFSFTPATTAKDQIIMADRTSSLVLNGCKLKITDTGLRLTKGTLAYQGAVTVDTKNGFYFSTVSATTWVRYCSTSTGGVFFTALRPDGKYLAIGGIYTNNGAGGFTNSDILRLYSFNGSTLTPLTSQPYGAYDYAVLSSAAWSPDGRYLAIGGYRPASGGGFSNTNEIRVYSFNGSTLTAVISQPYGSGGLGWVQVVSWSPDGRYLAIGGIWPASGGGFSNTDEIRVYSFDGSRLTAVTSQPYGSGGTGWGYAAFWSPDGRFLAVGGKGAVSGGGFANTDEIRIYSFNGSALTAVTSQPYGSGGAGRARNALWSPDGKYLAVGGDNVVSGGGFANTNELRVYQFNGSTLSAVASQPYASGGSGPIYCLQWSPSGSYLAIGGISPVSGGGFANTNELRIYQFNGTTLSAVTSQSFGGGGGSVSSIQWMPNGRFFFIGGGRPTTNSNSQVQIYAPVLGANTNPQAATNSLVYGNSALGGSANLNVSGNYTTLRGTILNQNV